jgi:uncharacterized membrane protein
MTKPNRIELIPHCSLSPRGALVFFGSLCFVSFGVAGVVAAQGFWPVLPFAGLEMALLAWALKVTFDRRREAQTITISDHEVLVEWREDTLPARAVFSRHWSQVKLRRPASRLHPSRLMIESQGRALEVGRFLTEEERRGLAIRLQRLIGGMNESPSLV